MYEVESIKKKKYSKKYFINFKDNTHEYILLDLDTLTKNSISVGVKLNEDEILNVLNDQMTIDVKQKAYSFVSYKPRSEFEVRKRLADKKFSQKHIKLAIDFLYKYKLLDDKEFTKSFATSYLERKPSGKFRLSIELKKKGVSESIIEETLNEIYKQKDTIDLAIKAAVKHKKKINYRHTNKQKELIIGFLKRRGFKWDIINQTIEKIF